MRIDKQKPGVEPNTRRFQRVLIATVIALLNNLTWNLNPKLAHGQTDDDVFEVLEPGVRLFGKPHPSVVMGAVLGFQSFPNTDRTLVVGPDGLRIWDQKKQRVLHTLEFEQPIVSAPAIAISHDHQIIAISLWSAQVGDQDQTSRVLLVDQELNQIAEFPIEGSLLGLEDGMTGAHGINMVSAITFSSDDVNLAITSGIEALWCDVPSGQILETYRLYKFHSTRLVVVQPEKLLAIGFPSYQVNRADGTISSLPASLTSLNSVAMARVDEPSNRIFTLSKNKVSIVDAMDGSSKTINLGHPELLPESFALSSDSSRIAVSTFDSTGQQGRQILVFNTDSGKLDYQIDHLPMALNQLEFSGDQVFLDVAFKLDAGFQRLKMSDQPTGKSAPVRLNLNLRSILLSTDGTQIAGNLTNTTGLVWDWSTGEARQHATFNRIYPTQSSKSFFTMEQKGQAWNKRDRHFRLNRPPGRI